MVSRQAIWSKKRYAEDPEFRKRLVARALAHYRAHKDEITEACESDTEPIPNTGNGSGNEGAGFRTIFMTSCSRSKAASVRSANGNTMAGATPIIVTRPASSAACFAPSAI
jgi:hypothetical protein